MIFSSILIALATLGAASAQSGSGQTTRYWDCCKESCGWAGKASVTAPIQSCGISNNPLSDNNVQSGCNGGGAYACATHSPFAVNDSLAYGFAAVNIQGGSESSWCCQCYELTFTSGPVSGQKMVVQATNTGGDLGNNHFDLMIPGGGVGCDILCLFIFALKLMNGTYSEYLDKAVLLNTAPHPLDGVRSMAVYRALPNALNSLRHYKQGASGVSHGSKALIIPRSLSGK
ncbi:unnamed protein product [Rhizoctonia solani]|uniref:Cellulase n=1 Tax=Rhizoctonia solani TaxID=456999 RepID=A0A8H3E5B3_9AGAM|nr:unnamed protein product [Rhizoctonia solani]